MLDEVLAEQEDEFDADTRWAVTWFEQYGHEDGQFGDAEVLSKAKNTGVNALADGRDRRPTAQARSGSCAAMSSTLSGTRPRTSG